MRAIASQVHRFVGRGRLIIVGQTQWRWRVGRGGNVVAYSEYGERRCAGAWKLLGIDPDSFDRGQWKRTRDGMVKPSNVAAWLSLPNNKLTRPPGESDGSETKIIGE